MMDQVDQLSAAGQTDEAQQILSKLFDESQGRVIEVGQPQRAASLTTQRFLPVRQWVQARFRKLLEDQPLTLASYRNANDEVAQAVFTELVKSNELATIESAAQRYALTSFGAKLHFLLCDHYLERGWTIAARQSLSGVAPAIRLSIDPESQQNSGSISWTTAWPKIARQSNPEESVQLWRSQMGNSLAADREPADIDRELGQAVTRLMKAAALENSKEDFEAVLAWSDTLAKSLEKTASAEIQNNAILVRSWFEERAKLAGDTSSGEVPTFARNPNRNGSLQSRVEIAGWYSWTQKLDRHTSSNDRVLGSKPRVAESELGILPYHPVIHDGRVFVNELRRIVAFDLAKGTPWPAVSPALPLFDSGIPVEALVPMGYPRVGVPRGTLTIADDCLYARMGSPVTGWASREPNREAGSLGYIVGLDLRRQGKLLPGFPLRFSGEEFRGAEPEGCPLAIGNLLFVPVAQRDNVGLRRFVVAVDRIDGQLKWRSQILATGTIPGGQQANLVSHQLLSHAGGRLFYSTNLGSIVCLDPMSGKIEWLVRYRRESIDLQSAPRADRYLYRDLTPCLVEGNLVYCAPQDSPEIFALDSATGDLVWSTSDTAAADVVHLLGIAGNSLIVSGDRVLWLDRLSGRIQGRFPAATTPGPLNALPSPRGIGRGLLAGGEVLWPTAREIYVFPAALPQSETNADSPPILRRIRLDTRASEGGNLLATSDWFLIAAPSRIFAFRQLAPKAAATARQVRNNSQLKQVIQRSRHTASSIEESLAMKSSSSPD